MTSSLAGKQSTRAKKTWGRKKNKEDWIFFHRVLPGISEERGTCTRRNSKWAKQIWQVFARWFEARSKERKKEKVRLSKIFRWRLRLLWHIIFIYLFYKTSSLVALPVFSFFSSLFTSSVTTTNLRLPRHPWWRKISEGGRSRVIQPAACNILSWLCVEWDSNVVVHLEIPPLSFFRLCNTIILL